MCLVHGVDTREWRRWFPCLKSLNPLMGTLKPQSNGPYDNTVIGTARRRLDGARPRRHRCTKCNSPPPSTAMCTNHRTAV